jgi:hypothetical protein
MLAFENLQELMIQFPPHHTAILPPPEFLSPITSTHLSKITIYAMFPPGEKLDKVLDAIKGYEEALCQLANQFDPSSSGSEKLVLKLGVAEESPDLAAILPRFRELGILQIEAMGT